MLLVRFKVRCQPARPKRWQMRWQALSRRRARFPASSTSTSDVTSQTPGVRGAGLSLPTGISRLREPPTDGYPSNRDAYLVHQHGADEAAGEPDWRCAAASDINNKEKTADCNREPGPRRLHSSQCLPFPQFEP